jgi:hypothetical protein
MRNLDNLLARFEKETKIWYKRYKYLLDIQISIAYRDKKSVNVGIVLNSNCSENYGTLTKQYIKEKTLVSLTPEGDNNNVYTVRGGTTTVLRRNRKYSEHRFSLLKSTSYDDWSSFLDKNGFKFTDIWINFNESIPDKDIFLNSFITCNLIDNPKIIKFIKSISNEIKIFYFDNLMQLIINEMSESLKRGALISAKTSIVGRNMSHNLGSHVLYYLRHQFKSDIDVLNSLLYNIKLTKTDDDIVSVSLINDKGTQELSFQQLELPFLKGIGTFLGYLQERQDFIAAISNDYFPSFSNQNFKDFIIDNFTKDKKALRHKPQTPQEENILLKYLAKSENLQVEILFQGEDLSQTIKNQQLYTYIVDIPGGILGRQAFFAILENIIRNSAKHGDIKDKNTPLKININIEDDSEFFKIKIHDYLESKEEVVNYINRSLKKELIDENFKLNEDNKGIKEILISSLFLRGYKISDINVDDRLDFINASLNDKNNITYELKMFKSKRLIIVVDDNINDTESFSFSTYSILPYTFIQNKLEVLSRYELVVDLTIDAKLKEFDLNFKRYLSSSNSTEINKQTQICEKKFIDYFLKFIEISFDEKKENFPKFLFNLESPDVPVNFIDTFYYSLIQSQNNKLINTNDISIDNENLNVIAFKRHVTDKPSEFLWPDSPDSYLQIPNIEKEDIKKNEKNNISQHEKYLNKFKELQTKFLSLENITGDNFSFTLVNNSSINDYWLLEQIEAAYAKILIIDERLYDTYIYENENRKPRFTVHGSLFKFKNIEIANVINQDLIGIFKNKIGEYKTNNKTNNKTTGTFFFDNKYTHISIHQSIIDKLYNYEKSKFKLDINKESFFKEFILSLKSREILKIVVHTGRGRPNYIKGLCGFQSLSDLEYALREPKFLLIKYFNSASYV